MKRKRFLAGFSSAVVAPAQLSAPTLKSLVGMLAAEQSPIEDYASGVHAPRPRTWGEFLLGHDLWPLIGLHGWDVRQGEAARLQSSLRRVASPLPSIVWLSLASISSANACSFRAIS
jgi:hypothetical protein